MKKIIIILLFMTLFSNKTIDREYITEEAIPIHDNDKIVSLDYKIMINNSKKNKIVYDTKVVDSINHYVEISNRNNFIINFKFINTTHDKYYLKKIVIYNDEGIIRVYNYNKRLNYTELDVNLDKNIIDKIIKNQKVIGKMKIIIEK